MAKPDSRGDLIVVSQTRYQSTNYLMKQERYKSVRPIIIANWEKFDTGEYIMPKCDRIKADAELIEKSLRNKFGDVLEFVYCYNLQREELMKQLKSEAQAISTKGTKRPDIFLCFIISRGKSTFFYDCRKRSKSEKIYFKEVIDIFNGENCKGLVLRPKLFFIQTEGKTKKTQEAGQFNLTTTGEEKPTTPVEADSFIYASTTLTESSEEKVSNFIKFLCEGLKSPVDVLDLTMKVNKQMFDYTRDTIHTPMCTSQLTKTLIL